MQFKGLKILNLGSTLVLTSAMTFFGCSKVETTYSMPENRPLAADGEPLFLSEVLPSADLTDFEAESQTLFEKIRRNLDTTPLPANSCAVSSVFQQNEIRVRFAIGYEDFTPKDFVSDLLELQHLKTFLVRACGGRSPLCGFQVQNENPSMVVLRKTLEAQSVIITITTSSISSSDSKNQNHPEQLEKSRWAAEKFMTAFEDDDIVIYWGHGRSGGGPDFAPPLRDEHNQTYYPSYKRVRRGYGLIQSGLGSRYQRAKFVGLFGCSTAEPSAWIRSRHPEVTFAVSNREIGYSEVVDGSLKFLNALLTHQCRPPEALGITMMGPFFKSELSKTPANRKSP